MIAGVPLLGPEARRAEALPTVVAPAAAGVGAGFGIGGRASFMVMAGGESPIPTLVPLCGADIRPAGSPSLAASLPALLVGVGHSTILLPMLRAILLSSACKAWGHARGSQRAGRAGASGRSCMTRTASSPAPWPWP